MEQAIFIANIENTKYVKLQHSRLYFGNEFCEYLIPSLEELRYIIDFIKKNKIAFTFVTPFVTNKGIEVLRPIFEYIIRKYPDTELVVNDWGVFRILRDEFYHSNLVLGRLLTKQIKDPRILSLKNKVSWSMKQYFKETNADTPVFSDFLSVNGIKRIEMDNVLQEINRGGEVLKASLYFPFIYVTTTRLCVTAACETVKNFSRNIPVCGKECRKYTLRLHHYSMPKKLFIKGNTQFYKNDYVLENLKQLHVDRLVYEPEIPM